MDDFLSSVLDIATFVFAVSTMASVGFSYTIQQIIDRLRHPRLVIGALIANFILVPLLAYVITVIIPLGDAHSTGLLIVAAAAGAPFVIALAQLARADVALASGLLVLLLVVTILYMPLVLPLIAPGIEVSTSAIATPLLLTMLLPLVIALAVDSIVPAVGERLEPIFGNLAPIALLVLIVVTVALNFEDILSVFGSGAILAAVLLLVGALASGYVLGMTGLGTREELALATGQRNYAAAIVVATQAIGVDETLVMVIVVSIVGFAVLFPAARALRPSDESAIAKQDVSEDRRAHG